MSQLSTAELRTSIENMIGPMNFFGMCQIIFGALTCLGFITALIGVPMIISGVRVREAARDYSTYLDSDNPEDLATATEGLNRFFAMLKIYRIIYIIFFILVIIGTIAFYAFIISVMMSQYPGGFN